MGTVSTRTRLPTFQRAAVTDKACFRPAPEQLTPKPPGPPSLPTFCHTHPCPTVTRLSFSSTYIHSYTRSHTHHLTQPQCRMLTQFSHSYADTHTSHSGSHTVSRLCTSTCILAHVYFLSHVRAHTCSRRTPWTQDPWGGAYSGLQPELRGLGAPNRGATPCPVCIMPGKAPKSSNRPEGTLGANLCPSRRACPPGASTSAPRAAAHPFDPGIMQGLGPALPPTPPGSEDGLSWLGDEWARGGSTKNPGLSHSTNIQEVSLALSHLGRIKSLRRPYCGCHQWGEARWESQGSLGLTGFSQPTQESRAVGAGPEAPGTESGHSQGTEDKAQKSALVGTGGPGKGSDGDPGDSTQDT